MEQNDFSIGKCKLKVLVLLIEVKNTKKLRYFSWCPMSVAYLAEVLRKSQT